VIRVFLPAYNEEVALPRLAAKIDAELKKDPRGYHITVLDDGSSDGTLAAAEALKSRYPVTVLRHEKNRGLGQAMIDGLRHEAAASEDEDAVVTLDCDDTHDPKYILPAVSKLGDGYDVVILSRYQKGGGERGLSPFRSILSRGAGLFLKLFFPIRGVQEYSCGFRAIRASALKKTVAAFGEHFVRLPHMGFVAMPEILLKFRMLGFRITEVPFVLEYGQKPGRSKNRPLWTIAGYFKLVLLYWGRKAPRAA
jgi:dolichol-phosphate mannosyltransferase